MSKTAVSFVASDMDTAVVVGNVIFPFCVPPDMNGLDLTNVRASCTTQGSTGNTWVMARRIRSGSSVNMQTGYCVLAYNAWTATGGTINTSNDDLATGDLILLYIGGIATGMKGVTAVFTFS